MQPSRPVNSTAITLPWCASRAQKPVACRSCTASRRPWPCCKTVDLKVALVTDGRMSGASGKVPAAIHVTPEAVDGGAIARIQNGDMIRIDADEWHA